MKLNDKDRKVASYIYFNGNVPISEIARAIGMEPHTVRRCIEKLEEHKIVAESAYINPMAAGFLEYETFITILTPGEVARKQLMQILNNDEHVVWISSLGGDYTLDVIFYVRDIHEIKKFIDDIYQKARDIEFTHETVANISMTYYPPRYLGPYDFGRDELTYGKPDKIYPIDKVDHKILANLLSEGFRNHAKLARKLGIPKSTLSYRIENLEKQRIIIGYGLLVVPFAANMTPFILVLHMSRINPASKRKLFEFGKHNPNVTYLIENVGAWDYQLGLRLADPRNMPIFVQEFKKVFEKEINEVKVVPTYEHFKFNTYPFEEYHDKAD